MIQIISMLFTRN